MKYVYSFLLMLLSISLFAQKPAGFEEIPLESESYWNGSDGSGSFTSSNLTFYNSYNAAWFSWSGFACSNITDTKTKGYGNQYSAITGAGINGSANYGVAYVVGSSDLEFNDDQNIRGLYITNATYTYYSMKEGDEYAKKFGGSDGTDPDYLKVIAEGIDANGEVTGNVEFFLADFRSDNSADDYIVTTWEWFDLSALGKVKKVILKMESTDNGMWGMNTPSYFCVDDVNGFGPVVLEEVTFASFDDVVNQANTYYNGSDLSGGFYSGNFYFKNSYNESWASWSGFAVSSTTDTETEGFNNQYSAITGHGVAGSSAYAVVYPGAGGCSEILLKKTKVSGFYISNSTYAYLAMKNGDEYARKFGGSDGTDPDWFKLTIEGYTSNTYNGRIEFYLADFRSDDSSKDYIVDDWQWVDISALGNVSRLKFSLSSSDNGSWGMNTPAYFVMDNLNRQIPTASTVLRDDFAKVYPNPFVDMLTLTFDDKVDEIALLDITGKIIHKEIVSKKTLTINGLSDLNAGVYLLQIRRGNQLITKKIVKQ